MPGYHPTFESKSMLNSSLFRGVMTLNHTCNSQLTKARLLKEQRIEQQLD